MIDQEVARHASHPSGKAAVGRAIAPKSTVHPQEDFLRKVFRIRSVAGKSIANIEDAARVATHKLLPGRTVALEALLDQLSVLLQGIICLESRYALGLPTMERKLLAKSSLPSPASRPAVVAASYSYPGPCTRLMPFQLFRPNDGPTVGPEDKKSIVERICSNELERH